MCNQGRLDQALQRSEMEGGRETGLTVKLKEWVVYYAVVNERYGRGRDNGKDGWTEEKR